LRLTRNLFASISTEMNILVAGISGPPAPFVPEEYHHAPGIGLAVTGFAPDGEHARVIERINAQLPPLAQMTTPIPYSDLQQMFDDANAFGLLAYDKAAYLEELTEGAITVIADQLARKSSPRSGLFVYRLDGAYSAVREEATAFGGGRSPRYAMFLIALSDDPAQLATDTTWVRDFWTALQPHAMGAGSYLNGEAEFPQDRVHASYGETKYTLLSAIKHRYDPDNVFHRNANITPMPGPPAPRAGS
jgi:hypothetical protein